MATLLYTIGHGNRSLEEFLALLEGVGIRLLVDVRTVPRSLKHPHFGRDALEQSLPTRGFRYAWEGEDLGGFRRKQPDSPHTALRSPGFRNYAGHMETAAFHAGAERLLSLGQAAPTAFFCAERLPWRCHRYLLSDYLVFLGARVLHLVGEGHAFEHRLSPLVRAERSRLIYDRLLDELGPKP